MSLKGYEWLDDNGKVIMTFTFKRLELDIWENTTKEELDKFKAFLKEQGEDTILHLNLNGHEVRSKRP